jgi:hypothetical protein
MRSLFWYIWSSLFLLLGTQPAFALPSITATATNTANNLPLDGQGNASTHVVKVANLTLSTNNPQGLTLTISSGNITKAGGTPIQFQVTTVADGAASPSTAAFTTPAGSNYTFSAALGDTTARDLYIKYTSAVLQDPGAYNAAISLVVTDN